MRFKDHFSPLAAGYARYRPRYPDALFAWLATAAPRRECCWDCATGSGQAATGLAAHFAQVIGTDASAEQLAKAETAPNIEYRTAPAEASALPDASVDLVTVAQALHWFDLDAFHAEVRRVVRPGGLIAVWTYALATIERNVDAVVGRMYREIDAFWPPERKHVETGYRELPFPFEPLPAPAFAMVAEWTLPDLIGYLKTWSAVRHCREATGRDPVDAIEAELAAAWGERGLTKRVRWPLSMRVGKI